MLGEVGGVARVAGNGCGWLLGVVAWQGDVTWRGWWLADFGAGIAGPNMTGRERRSGTATLGGGRSRSRHWRGCEARVSAPSTTTSNICTAITVRAELPSWRRSVAVSSVQP